MARKILLVEDENALSHALSLKLQAAGFEVMLVRDGQAALSAIDDKHFDLVLLDIIMPVVDGFKVLEQLRGYKSPPEVLVLSNLAQPEDEKRVLSLGASGYLVKSDTSLSNIVEAVKQRLNR